jgi:hypothetical protein
LSNRDHVGPELGGEDSYHNSCMGTSAFVHKMLKKRLVVGVGHSVCENVFFSHDMSKFLILFLDKHPNNSSRLVLKPVPICGKFARQGLQRLVNGLGKTTKRALWVEQPKAYRNALEKAEQLVYVSDWDWCFGTEP